MSSEEELPSQVPLGHKTHLGKVWALSPGPCNRTGEATHPKKTREAFCIGDETRLWVNQNKPRELKVFFFNLNGYVLIF